MSKAESLAALHAWRQWEVGYTPDREPWQKLRGAPMQTARSHGAAAVKAIREWSKVDMDNLGEHAPVIGHIRQESRLAFRAALDACGITGNL